MSLAELNTQGKSDEGIEVEILHPKTNLPLGIVITVLGSDSEAFRKMSRKNQNRRMEAARRGRGAHQTAEEIAAEGDALLAACTKAWRTGDDPRLELEPGTMFDCNFENARKLYADPGFVWLRNQIDQEMGDRSNFLQV